MSCDELPHGWGVATLAMVCEDVRYGFTASANAQPVGPRFLRITDIVADAVDWSSVPHCEASPRDEQQHQLLPGDIVIARTGASAGTSHYCRPPERAVFASYLVRFRADRDKADPRYVAYVLRSPAWWNYVRGASGGSAQPQLNAKVMGSFSLPLPPVAQQQRIAAVLGALDDKIDSNRRLAGLLEETAATLFRARFADFVGVEEFEESEIGRIPRGWRPGTLGEVAHLHRELVTGRNDLPYVGLDAMPRGSTVLAEWIIEDAPAGQASRFEIGDILFGKLRPYFHKVGVAPISGRCSTEIVVLRAATPELYGVVLGHASSKAFIDYCVSVSRGTRMPRAEWKDAAGFEAAVPPLSVAAEFTSMARTIYAQIRMLTLESRTLSAIRNALLPKLISGQIRVPNTADPAEVIEPAAQALEAAAS